jgi:hypothetical protein
MINMLKRYLIFVFKILILCTVTVNAQNQNASETAYPQYYHTVFENDYVVVYEMFALPGSGTGIHKHPHSLWISLSKARFEVTDSSGFTSMFDFNPSDVLWYEELSHSWKLLFGRAHLFIVEVKTADSGDVPISVDPDLYDSVKVDPLHHHVVFENKHIRVYEGMASQGARSPEHSHPPTVLISTTKSRFKVTSSGEAWYYDFNPFHVRWIGHFEHEWKVVAGDAHVFGIEIKTAAKYD